MGKTTPTMMRQVWGLLLFFAAACSGLKCYASNAAAGGMSIANQTSWVGNWQCTIAPAYIFRNSIVRDVECPGQDQVCHKQVVYGEPGPGATKYTATDLSVMARCMNKDECDGFTKDGTRTNTINHEEFITTYTCCATDNCNAPPPKCDSETATNKKTTAWPDQGSGYNPHGGLPDDSSGGGCGTGCIVGLLFGCVLGVAGIVQGYTAYNAYKLNNPDANLDQALLDEKTQAGNDVESDVPYVRT